MANLHRMKLENTEDQVLASLEKYVLAYEAATNRKISL